MAFGCRRVRAVYALLGSDYPMARPLGVAVGDTIVQEADDDDLLPGTYPVGTLSRDSVDDSIEDLYVYIKAVGRTYGDSIVLRWAVESYPEWDRLNRTGYDVLRHTEGEGEFLLDTLATGIRPMSLADFRRCYPDTIDSLAYMAMGAIYGEGDMTPEMTNYEPEVSGLSSSWSKTEDATHRRFPRRRMETRPRSGDGPALCR